MDLNQQLRHVPHLADLSESELDELAEALDLQTVDDGHVFIQQGTRGDTVFVLLEGEVIVESTVGHQTRELVRLKPGALFGLLALIDDAPRGATCRAAGPVRAGALSRQAYEHLAEGHTRLDLAFQRALGTQLARDYREVAQQVRALLAEQAETERPPPPRRVDVVVIGGGPHGLTYATWLKKWRPETQVAVVERRDVPGHKIGESTLSTATRSFISMGLPLPVLRRLFGNKVGIRFWWTDRDTDRLHRHLDVVDIEETFQVERRVLETAMQVAARRRGIELITGTRVDTRASDLDGPEKRIQCRGPNGEAFTLLAPMLCDASGPASVLARHKGLYRKAPERNQTFTAHSYYAYFKKKQDVPVPHWDEPATRHICFPGGWLWFITLTSWEQTPDENLRRMIDFLLDHDPGPDAQYPTRNELCERFGCVTEQLQSIGFTIRADQDEAKGLPVGERFQYYVDAFPAIRWVMDHFDLVEGAYDRKRTPYNSFLNLVHDSERYAGDGWCLVGDAASFVNPLFSPGLNFGSGSCYMAARHTVEALNKHNLSEASFAGYEAYMRDIYDALIHETDMYYRAFAHVDAYEWAIMLKLFFGAADIIDREAVYSERDPFVHDLLNPRFRAQVDRVRAVLREAEAAGRPVEEAAADVRAVVEPFVKEVLAQPDVRALDLGSVFNQYTSDGVRVEEKAEPRQPPFGMEQCTKCSLFMDQTLQRCPICGTPSKHRVAERMAG